MPGPMSRLLTLPQQRYRIKGRVKGGTRTDFRYEKFLEVPSFEPEVRKFFAGEPSEYDDAHDCDELAEAGEASDSCHRRGGTSRGRSAAAAVRTNKKRRLAKSRGN